MASSLAILLLLSDPCTCMRSTACLCIVWVFAYCSISDHLAILLWRIPAQMVPGPTCNHLSHCVAQLWWRTCSEWSPRLCVWRIPACRIVSSALHNNTVSVLHACIWCCALLHAIFAVMRFA